MQSIQFHCKVLTPSFLGGANGDLPELRAPSFKGVMRYWWRAMHGHLSIKALREQEARLFGGTDVGGRSKVLIRIPGSDQSIFKQSEPLVPHKEWITKEAIAPESAFTVTLSLMPTKEVLYKDSKLPPMEQLEKHFVLTCLLGGIGKRVRRGMGSIVITGIQRNEAPVQAYQMPHTLDSIFELIQSLDPVHFQRGKESIYSRFGKSQLFPFIKEIYLGRPNSNLLMNISQTTHQLKADHKQAYEASLGHASCGRFASPVFTTAIDSPNGMMPLITLLNTVPDKYHRQQVSIELQREFVKRII